MIAAIVIAAGAAGGWWFAQDKGHVPPAEHQHRRHGEGAEHYACEDGPLVFEIYPQAGASTAATRIGFVVAALDELVADLAELGSLIAPPKASPWGRRAVVADPDGHRVELIEAADGQP